MGDPLGQALAELRAKESDPLDAALASLRSNPLAPLNPRPSTGPSANPVSHPGRLVLPGFQADATRSRPEAPNPHVTHLPEPVRSIAEYLVDPIAENPMTSAALGVGLPALSAVSPLLGLAAAAPVLKPQADVIGGYLGQKAAELSLPPDVRKLAEADPTRIPGRQAATYAAALLAAPVAHAAYKATVPDVGPAVGEAFADVAKEAKGTAPADLPEPYLNQRFAERLQQGAEEAATAPKRGATLPPDPETARMSAFAAMLQEGEQAKPPKKTGTVEGLVSPADAVAQEAIQNYYKAKGFVRRPGGEPITPESAEPVAREPAPVAPTMAPEGGSAPPAPSVPSPVGSPRDALPSYPEGFAMGGMEGRIPELPKPNLRGNPEVPGQAVGPEVANQLDALPPIAPEHIPLLQYLRELGRDAERPDEAAASSAKSELADMKVAADQAGIPRAIQNAAISGELTDAQLPERRGSVARQGPVGPIPEGMYRNAEGVLVQDRRTALPVKEPLGPMDIPMSPEGTPRELRPGEPLLNPRTFDPSPVIQEQLAKATAELEAKGVKKTVIPQRVDVEAAKQLGREELIKMGLDPTTLDPKKVRHLTRDQILAVSNASTQAMDRVAAISKRLEDPTISAMEHEELSHLLENARTEVHNTLSALVVERGEYGRNLSFLRQLGNRNLDPDVWVVEAKRIAGDRPLSDATIATVRRLAREAMEACA